MPHPVEVMMDPAKYGYEVCPHCNGYGSSLKEAAARCTRCGGLGLVPKGATDGGPDADAR